MKLSDLFKRKTDGSTGTPANTPGSVILEGGDGSSPEQALLVTDIAQEYNWVEQNCPGFRPTQQMLSENNGKRYDVLTLQNAQGETRTVYFDLSQMYPD